MNLEHLSEKFELNDLEKQIVRYIQEHLTDLKSIGIRQMAKDNYTSTSTIYKLCNKFGFDGYSDMIYRLSDNNHSSSKHKKYENYLPHFIQLLNKHKKSHIIVFGMGFSAPIADYISQRLTLNGFYSMSVIHLEMLDDNFQDSTLLIVISNSGITTRLEEVVETAKNNHIDIITFTGN